jgi:hypothetical protein
MTKRVWIVAAVVVGAWWWRSHHGAEQVRPVSQAAVTEEGFAVIDGSSPRRIVELDRNGHRRAALRVHAPADARVIGLPNGRGVVWRDGKQIAIARVDDDGELDRQSRFGNKVQTVCEQTATNDAQFGVAWTESDGAVWFVHGPTQASAAELEASSVAPEYCGIASAGEKIALMWRRGARTVLTMCGRKCPAYPRAVAIDKEHELLGFGCTKDACVIAARDAGTTYVAWVKANGKLVWKKPLPSACADTRVEIVGLGARIAIAYSMGPEPIVSIASADGTLVPVWQATADPNSVPNLAWSDNRLLIAARRDGELATAILKLQANEIEETAPLGEDD